MCIIMVQYFLDVFKYSLNYSSSVISCCLHSKCISVVLKLLGNAAVLTIQWALGNSINRRMITHTRLQFIIYWCILIYKINAYSNLITNCTLGIYASHSSRILRFLSPLTNMLSTAAGFIIPHFPNVRQILAISGNGWCCLCCV